MPFLFNAFAPCDLVAFAFSGVVTYIDVSFCQNSVSMAIFFE